MFLQKQKKIQQREEKARLPGHPIYPYRCNPYSASDAYLYIYDLVLCILSSVVYRSSANSIHSVLFFCLFDVSVLFPTFSSCFSLPQAKVCVHSCRTLDQTHCLIGTHDCLFWVYLWNKCHNRLHNGWYHVWRTLKKRRDHIKDVEILKHRV